MLRYETLLINYSEIAKHVELAGDSSKSVLVDAFAGVGGNAIAFARSNHFKTIYAFEQDPATLACAKHNAEIYGVNDRIEWSQGDCFELLLELYGSGDNIIIFASPPWGGERSPSPPGRPSLIPLGPSYRSDEVFDLSQMQPYSLEKMMAAFSKVADNVILYLPRTSDIRQLTQWQPKGKLEVIHYCMKGASKALCAYFGETFTGLSRSIEQ
jgi:trimethylguanosine synthase